MKTVWVDADGCPVVTETIALCREFKTACVLLCDTAHEMAREGAVTITVSKGADSVDYALVNRVQKGDLVVTQDYGLAAMCLARGTRPLNQNGLLFTADNMDSLLFARHNNRKIRNAGGRIKGPAKRTAQQNEDFSNALRRLLEEDAGC